MNTAKLAKAALTPPEPWGERAATCSVLAKQAGFRQSVHNVSNFLQVTILLHVTE